MKFYPEATAHISNSNVSGRPVSKVLLSSGKESACSSGSGGAAAGIRGPLIYLEDCAQIDNPGATVLPLFVQRRKQLRLP